MDRHTKIVAVIQARMASTRLPGKVMKDILGKPMLWHMLKRLKLSKRIDDIVIAIPDTTENDILEDFATNFGFLSYRGSEDDVLSRYYEAAVKAGAGMVVRLTSDCPLIDPMVTDRVISEYMNSDVDYASNTISRTYPRGLDTEVFSLNALKKAHEAAKRDYEREHVTPYIYQHSDLFRVKSVEANGKLRRPDLRLTVDTEKDLELVREIFKRLYREGETFYISEVIDLLDRYPELVGINIDVKQKQLGE